MLTFQAVTFGKILLLAIAIRMLVVAGTRSRIADTTVAAAIAKTVTDVTEAAKAMVAVEQAAAFLPALGRRITAAKNVASSARISKAP